MGEDVKPENATSTNLFKAYDCLFAKYKPHVTSADETHLATIFDISENKLECIVEGERIRRTNEEQRDVMYVE